MEQSQTDFFGYLEMVLRRKWVVILCVIAGTAIAWFIARTLPAFYRSTTFILVEQQKIPAAYVTPTDSTPFEQRLSTIQQQVMSRTNLEKIINELNLYGKDGSAQPTGPVGKLKSLLGMKTNGKPSMESIVGRMRQDIDIEVTGGNRRRGGGDAFRISYIGMVPEMTMQVTSTLASLFIEENLKIKEQYAEGTSRFLVKELEKAKTNLTAQELAIRMFKEKRMGALPEQLDANLRTLDRRQLELQSVGESLRNALDRKALLEEQASVIPGVTAPTGTPLRTELAQLKRELASLLSMYKENYPDVVIVRNRVRELEEQILNSKRGDSEGEAGEQTEAVPLDLSSDAYASLSEVQSQISLLRGREARIRGQIKTLEKRVEDTPANEQKLADLMRDYDITRQNYQSLLEKKLSAQLAQNLEKRQKGARFRVIDPANFPESPFKPDRPMIVLYGVAGGAGVGVGIILLLELLNPAFRKPEDFIGVLDQPVLVSIPTFAKNRKNGSARGSKVSQKKRRGVKK